ncbi:hydroxyproline dehydrogenase isoform X3 [Oncorhynchus keta]|uniref:hydroxyproline dehydrogenase isoform X3 n=1 Tax=Oncorhynchus keta TaxID=8018 RepID=UPI00227A31B4|nr:hydroxyproline dehydrogenase isoform X3 [Oncorhynchus keta]
MMRSPLLRPSLHHFLSLRLLGTAAPKAVERVAADALPVALNFEDPSAFRVKSFGELLRALGVFQLCSVPVLVNNCGKLMSVARTLLGKRGFALFLRPSVYAQFVAGESEGEITHSMEKMSSLGLRPMLAVPIEEDLGESTGERRYNDNLASMLECVDMSHSNAWSKDPMMQLKITALLSPELCVKLSTLLSEQQYDLDLLVRAMDGEPISFPGLQESENTHFLCGLQRLNKVGEESRSLLLEDVRLSISESFCLGVKLVRGAYMDKERKLANSEGCSEPVHESWEHTNDSYNGSLDILLELISRDPQRYRIIVATHNEESVRRAVQRMGELGMDKDGGSVCFGQLLGMCDHVSLTLAQQGYLVYKSVPYGSVDNTLPYLVRRAQENRTVLQGIRKERDLLRLELHRRLRQGLRQGS